MAIEILMVRRGLALVPYDALAEEELQSLPAKPLMVKIVAPRSLPHHRLYWVCLGEMVHAGAATAKEDLHAATLIKTGNVAVCKTPIGEYIAYPQSTSFANMDQSKFSEYFDAAIRFWKASKLWDYLPDQTKLKLENGER